MVDGSKLTFPGIPKKMGTFLNQAVDPARAFQGFSAARTHGFYLHFFFARWLEATRNN